ncbi:Uncharacterized protein APZ42_002840, partial [Daphnia magna]
WKLFLHFLCVCVCLQEGLVGFSKKKKKVGDDEREGHHLYGDAVGFGVGCNYIICSALVTDCLSR